MTVNTEILTQKTTVKQI